MKGGVVTKLRLIVFLHIILFLWDDKGTLAGSLPQMHDSSQFPKFLVLDKPGGKRSLIEMEGKTGRKESVLKQTGRQKIKSRDFSRKAKSHCKDVTFGECPISHEKTIDISIVSKIETCQRTCLVRPECNFYRFNHQTKKCTLLTSRNKSMCNITAAPVEKQILPCLMTLQPCGSQTEEECEYTGNDVTRLEGSVSSHNACQELCQGSTSCKYWIFNSMEMTCILKREATRICNVYGGPKDPSYEECQVLEDYEK